MNFKRKALGLLMAVCLAAGLLPASAGAAGTGKTIQLGTGGISGYAVEKVKDDYMYYGTLSGTPIKWRVLDDQTNMGTEGLFLLSEALLAQDVCFNEYRSDGNAWQNSAAQEWCESFAASHFSGIEGEAILATTKGDRVYSDFSRSETILNGDKVFFLSAEEAENSRYGFCE